MYASTVAVRASPVEVLVDWNPAVTCQCNQLVAAVWSTSSANSQSLLVLVFFLVHFHLYKHATLIAYVSVEYCVFKPESVMRVTLISSNNCHFDSSLQDSRISHSNCCRGLCAVYRFNHRRKSCIKIGIILCKLENVVMNVSADIYLCNPFGRTLCLL